MENIPETIELRFDKSHKSIKSLPTIKLPNFCVLTGPNGSGKTHLLEAINNGHVIAFFENGTRIPQEQIRYLELGAVLPVNTTEHNANIHRNNHWGMAKRFENEFLLNNRRNLLTEVLHRQQIAEEIISDVLNDTVSGQRKFVEYKLTEENKEYFYDQSNDRAISFLGYTLQHWNNPRNQSLLQILAEDLNKNILLMETSQITDEMDRISISSGSLFFDLTVVVATYHYEFEKNDYKKYRVEIKGDPNETFLTEIEFQKKYGPKPWELINVLMESMKLDLRLTPPRNGKDDPYKLTFEKDNVTIPMTAGDLSGGERVVIAMATNLYGAETAPGPKQFPRLMLFDEVDAPLHPSLAKNLVTTLQAIFKKTGSCCILTTHSPSTVAMTPTKNLFEINVKPREVKAVSREKAIHFLTSGLLTVTESTRFIFCEAKADSQIYQALFNFLKDKEKILLVPNLIFMPTSDEKNEKGGGKDQVKQWVEKLSTSPAIKVGGIIDRDADNVESKNIFVLNRYAVENYLLDPLLVVGVMLNLSVRPPFLTTVFERMEAAEIRTIPAIEKQKIVNEFTKFLESKRPELAKEYAEKFEVRYLDGTVLELPTWLREVRGHDLMKFYKAAIHTTFLNENIFSGTYEKLTKMLTDVLPEYIPVDLKELLESAQK